jgi:predicted dehydrogenase
MKRTPSESDAAEIQSRRAFSSTLIHSLLALPLIDAAARVNPAAAATRESASATSEIPVRVGIAGLTHDHVHGILQTVNPNGFKLVGIAESNRELTQRYRRQYQLDQTLLHASLDEMLERAKPDAVWVFNSTVEHFEVVEKCAPRGVHVMVEKPLAVSLEHARKMQALAEKHGIQLLTNYETTWYASHYEAKRLIETGSIGELRKLVVHDGHQGPKEIGCSQEFLEWLTDPVKNGGGALMDFGCYGANLLTWFMQGRAPDSVTAITQQLKPSVYPKVDDEATIIVTYPKAQGIIQASWNWPYGRKDIDIYGAAGAIRADRESLTLRKGEEAVQTKPARKLTPPDDSPFTYLAAVVRGTIKVAPLDLSALELNMTAMRILEAAKESARSGKTVLLS